MTTLESQSAVWISRMYNAGVIADAGALWHDVEDSRTYVKCRDQWVPLPDRPRYPQPLCHYCKTAPGSGQRCQTCGAPKR